MNCLRAIVEGLARAVLSWAQKRADQPKTTEDANTPEHIRNRYAISYDKWMRRKQGSDRGPKQ